MDVSLVGLGKVFFMNKSIILVDKIVLQGVKIGLFSSNSQVQVGEVWIQSFSPNF
jgi:hypothetical protein